MARPNTYPKKTSFPAGAGFLGDSDAGVFFMEANPLLALTSQNALGKIVTEFVENSTTTVSGKIYVYGGKVYKALTAYNGVWDATKFALFNFCDEAVKMLGLASDIGITDANNAVIGSLIYCGNISNVPVQNVNLLTLGRSYSRGGYFTQIAFKVNSTDIYIRGNSSDGSTWTSWKKVLTEDDYNKVLDVITLCCKVVPLNLNDTSIWEVGGISASSGKNENNNSRLRTKTSYEIFPTTTYSIAYQNGMTCPSGFAMYCYAADGSFLGRVSTNNSQPIAAFTQYPTTKYIRFGFTNLVGGQTISAANLANIAVFSGNLGVYNNGNFDDLKRIGCFKFNSALTLNTTYIPQLPRIHDNFILQFEVSGEIDDIYLGMGYLKTQGLWLEVTPTKVYMKGGSGDTQRAEYTHGLTLGTNTIVKIWRNNYENDLHFSVETEKMDVYENTFTPTGQFAGQVFARNVAATEKNLSLNGSYSIKRVTADVWIVGDSYCGCHTHNCWPYLLIQTGAKSFFIEEENGIGAADAWNDFILFASKNSTPKLLVWAIGMNNSADSGGTPPSTWVTVTNYVVDWCRTKNVKLAFVTIPTIPTKDNSAKNSYLRSLASDNIVIVDAAAAVEQEGTQTWKYYGTANAFIGSDEIHPSEYGAKAILAEVLRKFPEIAVE